jgi:mRNA-degrading endonuclease YafQ of YafQ-DinJ toxin-antitoxin module
VKKEKKLFNEIRRLKEFEKDFQKLLKKFKTLKEDMETFIKVQLDLYHKQKIDNSGVFRITNLNIDNPKIYKAKKFACKSLRGTGVKSGIRIIYAYYEEEDIIEFIEIFFKGNKENEDRDRIYKYYKK